MGRSGRGILAVLPPILVALGLAQTVAAAEAASPVQQEILALFFTILIFALVIGVLVHILLLSAVQWYKDSPRWRPPKGHLRTHDKRLEIGWTIGPALILAGVVVLTLFALQSIERPRAYDYAIDVYGAQWAWRFRYPVYAFPNGTWNVSVPDSSGTMYIQEGLTFLLRVHTDDVIHAFYVPDLGIKIDAVPGRVNIFWVRATIPSTYTVNCAEFCGLGHSHMNGEVVVFPPGTQEIPYGPPPGSVPVGFDTPKYDTIVDVAFKEHPGDCEPQKAWSIDPCRITLGSNFNVTLRVWNNETTVHQFEIGAPISLVGPIQESRSQPVYFNFNTGSPGQKTFWCNISGHRALGMEGILNVTAPQDVSVAFSDTSIAPSEIVASLGATLNLQIQNNGVGDRQFAIGPPYPGSPLTISGGGGTATMTILLNRTTDAAWYGDQAAGITGTLRVVSTERGPPPPPPPRGFPVVEVTFGLTGLAAAAAIAFNFKLARDARRRRRVPPEEE